MKHKKVKMALVISVVAIAVFVAKVYWGNNRTPRPCPEYNNKTNLPCDIAVVDEVTQEI